MDSQQSFDKITTLTTELRQKKVEYIALSEMYKIRI